MSVIKHIESVIASLANNEDWCELMALEGASVDAKKVLEYFSADFFKSSSNLALDGVDARFVLNTASDLVAWDLLKEQKKAGVLIVACEHDYSEGYLAFRGLAGFELYKEQAGKVCPAVENQSTFVLELAKGNKRVMESFYSLMMQIQDPKPRKRPAFESLGTLGRDKVTRFAQDLLNSVGKGLPLFNGFITVEEIRFELEELFAKDLVYMHDLERMYVKPSYVNEVVYRLAYRLAYIKVFEIYMRLG